MDLSAQACFDVILDSIQEMKDRAEDNLWPEEVNDLVNNHVNETLYQVIHEIADDQLNELIHDRIANSILDDLLQDIIKEQKMAQFCILDLQAEAGVDLLLDELLNQMLPKVIYEASKGTNCKLFMKKPRKYKSMAIDKKMNPLIEKIFVEEVAASLSQIGLYQGTQEAKKLIATAFVEQVASHYRNQH